MGAPVKIQGLVTFHRVIRDWIRRGVAPEDADELREQIRETVWAVEDICSRSGRTPDDLPAPSRRAYAWLAALDLEDLPPPRPGTPAPHQEIRVSGAVKTERVVSDRIWRGLDGEHPDLGDLLADLRAHCAAIEDLCDTSGADPSALARRSRRIYGWLKFLCERENLARHVKALRDAKREVEAALLPRLSRVRIDLVHSGSMWRSRTRGSALSLRVSEGFIAAPPEVWSALGERVAGERAAAARRVLGDFVDGEAYAAVLWEMASHALPEAEGAGVHHHLGERFMVVNREFFGGEQDLPRLVWGSIPTGRKFGHYQPARDTVMLSVTLDDAEVPEFVIDYVLFHELLHRRLGSTWENGRRISHGPEFRAAERKFPRYAEADAFLTRLARG